MDEPSFVMNHWSIGIEDYEPKGPNEGMEIKKGEYYYVYEEVSLGWSLIEYKGIKGYSPSSYLSYVKKKGKEYIKSEYDDYYKSYQWKCNQCLQKIDTFQNRYHCLECKDYDEFNLCYSCYKKMDWKKDHLHEPIITRMRKHPGYLHWLIQCDSNYETLERCFLYYSDRPCLGIRLNNQYIFESFQSISEKVKDFGSGLIELYKNGNIGICSKNRIEWFISDLASIYSGITNIGLPRIKYLNKNDENGLNILINGDISIIICSKDVIDSFIHLSKYCSLLKFIIQIENDEIINNQNIKIFTFQQIIQLGKDKKNKMNKNRISTDIRTIVYTSGSTGEPKGAIVNEEKWLKGITRDYWPYHPLVTITFHPLDHQSDRQSVMTTIVNGGRIGIYSGDIENIYQDIQILSPCMISSTPRLFNKIYKEYQNQLTLFKNESELLKEFSNYLGTRIKSITTGGAPTSKEVFEFLKKCFKNVKIYNGYASTECGSIFLIESETNEHIFKGVEIKLRDVPELNYYLTDQPYPRGEILVKSDECITGYYKSPELTKELIDENGYYATGDIGLYNTETKRYSIIDRKKSFFKLAQGEFIAPEKLELIYLKSKYIDQILIYGNSLHHFILSVIVPIDLKIKKEEIIKDLIEIAKKENLQYYEIPRDILIEKEKFTIENKKMTSSEKLSRNYLNQFYKKNLEELYKNVEKQLENQEIQKMIKELLNIQQDFNENQTFKELGIDSLSASKLSHYLNEKYQLNISADLLLNENIKNLKMNSSLNWNLDKEFQLNEEIQFQKREKKEKIKRILLTGCTGYLGIFLLYKLLKYEKDSKIICLIRKGNKDRLIQLFKDYQLNIDLNEMNRIIIINGDLSKDYLGIDLNIYHSLPLLIDKIYHNGCLVNHIYSIHDLYDTNIKSLLELLKLSKYSIPFIFISTLSISPIQENDILSKDYFHSLSGYSQSKLISEHLLFQASKRGLPCIIFRPNLIGLNQNGISNINDWFIRFIRGIIYNLSYPKLKDNTIISMSNIDFVSDSIIQLSLNSSIFQNNFSIFNILNENEFLDLNDLFKWLIEYGYSLKELNYNDWYSSIEKNNPIYPIKESFKDHFPNSIDRKYQNLNYLNYYNNIYPTISKQFIFKSLDFLKYKNLL